MKWYWLFVVVACCASLTQSDESKLALWHSRGHRDVTIDRVASVLLAALAARQLFVLWGAK